VVRSSTDDEVRLTFAELDARANRLAHALTAAGVGPGDHIGCHLYDGNQYVEATLAAFKIRAVPVNVNFATSTRSSSTSSTTPTCGCC